ncbi:MAG TPA: hypothetical protein PLO89_08535, partial [Spirochaetota bacterium]|nr:hypothetical protein [Spirochaetota bacterium]
KDESEGKYFLKKNWTPLSISQTVLKEIILGNLVGIQKNIFKKYYRFDRKSYKYFLKEGLTDEEKKSVANNVPILVLRCIFLYYNKENEMYVELDGYGSPSPHKFPRLSEAKSKALFDIHFVWGGKWEDPSDPNKNVSLAFSLNLTNFIMLSLEISVKYNFIVGEYPFSPYLGASLYGGFWDGFPIGLSVIGGSDIYPAYTTDKTKNFYVLGEARIGGVFLSGIYFDTGYDYEGIWKKFKFLLEGGFYAGVGYRFDGINTKI